MADKVRLQNVALVLGGSAYGTAHQVGQLPHVCRFFKNFGVDVKLISGVSGGAISGATLAQAQTQEELFEQSIHLKTIWTEGIEPAGPESVFPFSKWAIAMSLINLERSIVREPTLYQLVDGNLPAVTRKLMEFNNAKSARTNKPLQDMRWATDWERVASSPIRYDCTVLNEGNGDYEIFSNRIPRTKLALPLELRLGTVASASLPGFYDPVMIDDVPYSDVGYIRLRQAFEMDVDLILVLLPYPEKEPVDQGSSWISRLWVFRQFFVSSAKTRHFNSKVIRTGIERANSARHAGIRAPWILPVYMGANQSIERPTLKGYTFQPGDLTWVMEQGERDIAKAIDEIQDRFLLS